MTEATHYNGKKIPGGTWLANAARVASVEGDILTSPTPQYLHALASSAGLRDRVGWRISVIAALHQSADAIADIAADLKASAQMHEQARALLDETLTDRDRALAKLSDAEEDLGVELRKHETTLQAFGVVVKRLADAPHGPYCASRTPVPEGPRYGCNCWKEGL